MPLEKMSDFFDRRKETYDEHMINNVEGCKEGYKVLANLISVNTETLLDLGCGTGLELTSIFEKIPDLSVTGIDMCEGMLGLLREKYPDKNITLIVGSYLGCYFGKEKYDAAISFETMHHMSHEDKLSVYSAIYNAVKIGGVYIEGDYMVKTQEEEDFFYAENARMRKEQGIADGEFYHYDTPCTIDNQIMLLKKAGFSSVEKLWNEGNTVIIRAIK